MPTFSVWCPITIGLDSVNFLLVYYDNAKGTLIGEGKLYIKDDKISVLVKELS